MLKNIFAIPIFIDEIDLEKITIDEQEFSKTWLSETPSTFIEKHNITDETFEYLIEIFVNNLGEKFIGQNPRFGQIWRNKYDINDWQDMHIHPNAAWSFIIYETVDVSNTVFMNPCYKDIQNHIGTNCLEFPLDFRPNLAAGSIIIFPSFIEHYVKPGGKGTTISGNVYMDYN